jgi:hypothetical protein
VNGKQAAALAATLWLFGGLLGLGFGTAHAHAGPGVINLTTMTVDGTDYPVCVMEDCSDQPGQVGLWLDQDTGNWYLSVGETSYLVVDDTAIDEGGLQ